MNKDKQRKKAFLELLKIKAIVKLSDTEKENYLKFFDSTYKDNLDTAIDNLKKHPRWSIIAGYYAMHDLTKLFLAKRYNLKIVDRVHFATIIALSNILRENEQQISEAITLLKKAKEIFDKNIIGIKPAELVFYLRKGKSEREKVQYYHPKMDLKEISEKASYFLNYIAIPFVKLIEKLNKKN
ncbi:MAG: hypothetical protein K6T16_02095 [Candidatus Pacearchaeota archaeon]|nr:hypothetical protein [Candidatus Pacearchaeota archaeon]